MRVEGDDEAGSQPMEPHVGIRFDSLKVAREHYNSYALKVGFSIKMNTSRRSAYTNILEKQQFVCNKYRKPKVDDGGAKSAPILDPIPDPKPGNGDEEIDDEPPVFNEEETEGKKKKKRKRETIKQTECKAKMLVKLIDGRWEVTHFVRDHNHPLFNKPSLHKYLRSHQGIPPEEADFLRILYNCNLSRGHMMHVMSEFYGSELMVPYIPKAITNLYTSFRRDDTKEGDMIETIAHFKDIHKTDPDFFYKVKYDEEERVVNIFWVYGLARKAYAEAYHDCISFDTTYMTNMYNMPFAPFIGINRHGQSFMFWCAFVRQEMATSFDWVFETFLEAMNGKPPDNFITNQDIAMKQSIENILPNTVHRCCRCHIMKKPQEKVGWLPYRNPGLAEDFNYCVDFSFTPDEFEQNWAGLMMKYDAITHTHTSRSCMNTYQLGCHATSSSGSSPSYSLHNVARGFNVVLNRYVNPHNSILNFVKQYEKIQTHILVKEGCNDYRTEHLEVEMWSRFPIERQAYESYTRDLYRKFREEFDMIGRYNVFPVAAQHFELRPNQESVAKYGSRNYLVQAKDTEGSYLCECCKMEKDSMLCCHILKVFTHLGVDIIPDRYILQHWTPNAVPSALGTGFQPPDEMPPQLKRQIRQANITTDFQKLVKFASGSDAAEAIVYKHMRGERIEITHLNKSRKKKKMTIAAGPSNDGNPRGSPPPPDPTGHVLPTAPIGHHQPNQASGQPAAPGQPSTATATGPTSTSYQPCDVVPRDPPRSTTKGRAKSRRFHSTLELHPKKKNKCSHCNSTEHTAGGCPMRLL